MQEGAWIPNFSFSRISQNVVHVNGVFKYYFKYILPGHHKFNSVPLAALCRGWREWGGVVLGMQEGAWIPNFSFSRISQNVVHVNGVFKYYFKLRTVNSFSILVGSKQWKLTWIRIFAMCAHEVVICHGGSTAVTREHFEQHPPPRLTENLTKGQQSKHHLFKSLYGAQFTSTQLIKPNF